MANLKKTLQSGAVLEASLAPFQDGLRLKRAVASELLEIEVEFGEFKKGVDFMQQKLTPELANMLKNIMARLMASEKIEAAMWPCMARSTRDGQKINVGLFEDEEIRKDYTEIMKEVLWFNLSPFVSGLASMSAPMLAGLTSSQK